MKIAFYSAALGDLTLAEAAEWGRQAGFDGVEIDIARHVHDPTETAKAVEIARGAGLEVCAVTVFGNLLDQNVDKRNRVRDLVKRVLAEASKAAVPALVVFPGRNETISEDENYHDIAAFLESLAAASSTGTKILIENWPSWSKNFIATTPHGWRRLFSMVKSPDVGLEFDPSHLLWQGIDPSQAAASSESESFFCMQRIPNYSGTEFKTSDIAGVGGNTDCPAAVKSTGANSWTP